MASTAQQQEAKSYTGSLPEVTIGSGAFRRMVGMTEALRPMSWPMLGGTEACVEMLARVAEPSTPRVAVQPLAPSYNLLGVAYDATGQSGIGTNCYNVKVDVYRINPDWSAIFIASEWYKHVWNGQNVGGTWVPAQSIWYNLAIGGGT